MGSARSVWATLGLPPFNACVLSWSTLLRLQVALKWNCLKWAQGCGHFPGLSCSGSGSWVRHKGAQIQLGLRFVPFPGPCSSGNQVLGEYTLPRCAVVLSRRSYHLPHPSCSFSWVCSQWERCLRCAVCLLWGADLWLRPSWWMSTTQYPRKAWLATGSLHAVW